MSCKNGAHVEKIGAQKYFSWSFCCGADITYLVDVFLIVTDILRNEALRFNYFFIPISPTLRNSPNFEFLKIFWRGWDYLSPIKNIE